MNRRKERVRRTEGTGGKEGYKEVERKRGEKKEKERESVVKFVLHSILVLASLVVSLHSAVPGKS